MKAIDPVIEWWARMPVWLQWSWGIWLMVGIVLLILSLPSRRGVETASQPPPAAKPAPPPADTSSDSAGVTTIPTGPDSIPVGTETRTGTDSTGKKARFAFDLMTDETNWELNRDNVVEFNRRPFDFPNLLRSEGMQARFDSVATDIIAIGTASEEGGNEEEYDLALRRAKQLTLWLRQSVRNPEVVFRYLVLGKYKGSRTGSPELTAYQRGIVIVRVKAKDPGINLEEALRDALLKEGRVPFRINQYPAFDLFPRD